MKNIVWAKTGGGFSVTEIADTSIDSNDHAAHLKSVGAIPADWNVYSVDGALPPQDPDEAAEQVARQAKSAAIAQAKADAKADAFVQQFVDMTDADRNNYVDTACAGLPVPVRNFLKKLTFLAQVAAKEQYK